MSYVPFATPRRGSLLDPFPPTPEPMKPKYVVFSDGTPFEVDGEPVLQSTLDRAKAVASYGGLRDPDLYAKYGKPHYEYERKLEYQKLHEQDPQRYPLYLGETPVPFEESPFFNYKPIEFALEFLGQGLYVDGDHHKQWYMDQTVRLLHNCPFENVRLARWSNGTEQWRYDIVPNEAYKNWRFDLAQSSIGEAEDIKDEKAMHDLDENDDEGWRMICYFEYFDEGTPP